MGEDGSVWHDAEGDYLEVLFHLIGDGPQNRRVACCTASQQRAMAAFLWYVVDTRSDLIVRYGGEAEVQRALEIWSPIAA